VRVPKAGLKGTAQARPQAQEGNPKHVGAPMPGMIATVSVKPGQNVKKGDALLSLEAMKMETLLTAPEDGKVAAVNVRPGETVQAKELLVELG